MPMKLIKKLFFPAFFLIVFIGIALWRYAVTGKVFYLYNFGYIGFSLALGLSLASILPKEKIGSARRVAQVLIGTYLLGYVGFISKEDLQIEGFWIYLFSGFFAGATLHYFIAKIVGTAVFNRGWCGWACWSAMVFDLLPWRKPSVPIRKRLTGIRYVHFIVIAVTMIAFYFFSGSGKDFRRKDELELYWLLIGNCAYYGIGILLAALLRDNRAFCKYACPIPVFMKIGARFALLKNEIDETKCVECKKCEEYCPMQIKLLDYKRAGRRICSTECILCQTCESVCPKNAVAMTFKIDAKKKELRCTK
jgi:ferredoxin-type protein NapH